ncbi:hypothetical protein F4560_001074 [Saccharothrix ecbatanensis]|uniref:site-specific DNA-methyltransferase (adenine-specific) n=1 Tax=Saccharothrix ecbatanensis TaxID=1105145 RepID=A0A7W9HG27_9PSEU|nr:N-6 DNA methylase [Saccharothrix ecbatanensis]MBB5801306.1 hypothetical protein [Saccharothrix ecbatanensis]
MHSQKHPNHDVQRHAVDIAEAVDEAWHSAHRSGPLEVPVSVVAALALIAPPVDERTEAADWLLAADEHELARFMTLQWKLFVRARPDLVNRAWPLIRTWCGQTPPDSTTLQAAKSVADATINAGQLDLTGTTRRRDVDLLGLLLAALRSRTAKTTHGEFYTPADISMAMAALQGPPEDGSTFLDPAAGTGGLLRATANTMRAAGRDPTTVTWWAVDTDELAIACLAVNTVLWELGHKVVLGVGNSLTDDWAARAVAERADTLQIARDACLLRAVNDVVGLDSERIS